MTTSGSRIALFGGSFDPPHLGHKTVIDHLLASGLVDQVWLVPSGVGRYDKKSQASVAERMAMTELFLDEYYHGKPELRIETCDAEGKIEESATYRLMCYLKQRHPEFSFAVLIGADNIDKLSTWKFPEQLKAEVNFLAVKRIGQSLPRKLPNNVTVLPDLGLALSSVSSSQIRAEIAKGQNCQGLTAASVWRLIEDLRLYRNA